MRLHFGSRLLNEILAYTKLDFVGFEVVRSKQSDRREARRPRASSSQGRATLVWISVAYCCAEPKENRQRDLLRPATRVVHCRRLNGRIAKFALPPRR